MNVTIRLQLSERDKVLQLKSFGAVVTDQKEPSSKTTHDDKRLENTTHDDNEPEDQALAESEASVFLGPSNAGTTEQTISVSSKQHSSSFVKMEED